MSGLRVRPMQAADVGPVLELANALAEAPHWRPEAYQAALDPANIPVRLALVAELETRLVGFAVALLVADEAELESIAVAVGARRQGVGRLLLAQLTELAQARNLSRFLLEVRASNQRALGFYQATGWSVCGQRKRYYSDPEEDAVLMERRLLVPGSVHGL